jgi:hypothetical protein
VRAPLAARFASPLLRAIRQLLRFENFLSAPAPFNLTFLNYLSPEISQCFCFGGIDVVSEGREFTDGAGRNAARIGFDTGFNTERVL